MKTKIYFLPLKACYYTGKILGKMLNLILPNRVKNLILKNY